MRKVKRKEMIALVLSLLIILPFNNYSYAETDAEKIKRLEQQLDDLRDSNGASDQAYKDLKKQYDNLLEEQKEKNITPRIILKTNFGRTLADSEKTIKITLINPGEANFSNGSLTLSSIPAGITLQNTSSTFVRIGEMLAGQEKEGEFNLKIGKEVKSGSYPLVFNWAARYGKITEREYTFSQTFYMEIINNEEKKEPAKVAIQSIAIPQSAAMNQDFTLNFQVANTGKDKVEGLKVSAEASGGIVNKSQNIFTESVLEPGKPKSYSVTFYAPGGTGEEKVDTKNYPIKITVESTGATTGGDKAPADSPISISQYTGILIIGNKGGQGADGVKAPQLMVENYSYGGSYVEAGKNFTLNLTMVNTSKDKRLRNIKVSLNSEEGTFIPYNTSNSFFIDSLPPGGRTTKNITFSTKPDAKAQTIALNLESTYEDMKGNALTAKDIISIPVTQTTKLDIDEPSLPPELYSGQMTNVSFSFYNTGKNVLRNLKITAEGDFDTQGSVSYFVGNMDPGKSDSYDLMLIPRAPGKLTGTVIFTYENVQGEEQMIEKAFEGTVMEMPPMEDLEHMPQEPEKTSKTGLFVGIGLGVLAIAEVIFWRKKRKKRKEREMDIDE